MRNTGMFRRSISVRRRRVSGANLEVERFGLPNKPTGTPERLEKPVRCGDWRRGLRAPSPCPYPKGDNPSVTASL